MLPVTIPPLADVAFFLHHAVKKDEAHHAADVNQHCKQYSPASTRTTIAPAEGTQCGGKSRQVRRLRCVSCMKNMLRQRRVDNFP